MPSASKEKRLAKKAAEGKLDKKSGKAAKGKKDEPQLDAHGNPVEDDAPATDQALDPRSTAVTTPSHQVSRRAYQTYQV